MKHRYHLLWKGLAKPEGFDDKDVPESHGACDAMVFMSILFPEDGSYSMKMLSMDGRTGQGLDDLEVFKAWALMAKMLANSQQLDEDRKHFASTVFHAFMTAVEAAAAETKGRVKH